MLKKILSETGLWSLVLLILVHSLFGRIQASKTGDIELM